VNPLSARPVPHSIFRLHAAGGARVALRNSRVGAVIAIAFLVMAPSPVGVLRALADSLAASDSSPWALYLVALLGAALARQAVPQVLAGQSGWLGSLPTSRTFQRAGILAALVYVQAPLLVFVLCCELTVVLTPSVHLSPGKVLASALVSLGAAMMVVPCRRRGWSSTASVVSVLGAARATGLGLLLSIVSLAAVNALADPAPVRAARRRRSPGRLLPQRIAWRAMAWRALPPILTAALPLGGAWLVRVNNGLTGAAASTSARVGGTLAVVMVLARLANLLHLRRPTWGWERSLPSSSQRRVLDDVVSLLVGVVPAWIVVAVLDGAAAAAVVAVSPLLALLAAAAMRRAGARLLAASGEVVVVGCVIAVAVGYWPWMTVVCVGATPLALWIAARRERNGAVTQWLELHHSVEGDAVAWSGS
jgi:hypothetical protein